MAESKKIAVVIALAAGMLLAGCFTFHSGRLPNEPEDATIAEVGDTFVHYVDAAPEVGQKTLGTVVLVHGFGASITEWKGLIPVLTDAGYRVVAIDLKGHGWTSRPPGDYSIAAQAQLLLSLLDQLGVGRFAIVGHSWGSAVSLHVAADVPERVSHIVLYNGMFYGDQQPVIFSWSRVPVLGEIVYGAFYTERQDEKMSFAFYNPDKFVTEDVVERLEEYLDRPGTVAATLAGIRAMDFTDLEQQYRQIDKPVLVIWGEEDEVTPLEWGQRLVNELPNARMFVVPLCGHLPMIEVPSSTANEVIRFLGGGES